MYFEYQLKLYHFFAVARAATEVRHAFSVTSLVLLKFSPLRKLVSTCPACPFGNVTEDKPTACRSYEQRGGGGGGPRAKGHIKAGKKSATRQNADLWKCLSGLSSFSAMDQSAVELAVIAIYRSGQ